MNIFFSIFEYLIQKTWMSPWLTLEHLASSSNWTVFFREMDYKMQIRGILWNWCMNKSFTLWILDSIHIVKYVVSITITFVSNLKLKIEFFFVIWLNSICGWNLLWLVEIQSLNVVIFGDFLMA
jgi:hypothetical protein